MGVKLQKLTGDKNYVLNTTVGVGKDASLVFHIEGGWGEYRLTLTRPTAADPITITNLGIFSLTPDEMTGIMRMEGEKWTMRNGVGTVYDLQGRKMESGQLQHGLYLMSTIDGKARKMLIRGR